jgi:hypothetical protein
MSVVLQEPAWHRVTSYPHGPTGLIVVDDPAAAGMFCRVGGYRAASPAEVQSEIDILEARLALLRSSLPPHWKAPNGSP